MTLTEIRSVLRERGLAPNKRFGQNFLHDENLARWIVAAAQPAPGERVLEIGPGLGALTGYLLEAGAEVTALEIDNGLADYLEQKFAGAPLRVVRGDALKTLPSALPGQSIALGNLPYNVAVPLMLECAVRATSRPRRMVWMVQKELADRVRAAVGTDNYNSASVVFQMFTRLVEVRAVGRKVFYPEPQVDSTILVVEPVKEVSTLLDTQEARFAFVAFVRAGFQERRKKLAHLVKKFFLQDASHLSSEQHRTVLDKRPQDLAPGEWVELWAKLGHPGCHPH